jgi:ssDNA-binding Zn-finger/Zn-ribbon topoisomerase 1
MSEDLLEGVIFCARNRPKPRKLNVRCSQGHPMVPRVNASTGGAFLGCSHYPECRETRELPTYLKLVAEGHEQLPGMEAL